MEDGTEHFTLAQRLVLRAIPTMPEVTTAGRLAKAMPYLSRSTIDETLRLLRSHVMVLDGNGVRVYTKYREGSLL